MKYRSLDPCVIVVIIAVVVLVVARCNEMQKLGSVKWVRWFEFTPARGTGARGSCCGQ